MCVDGAKSFNLIDRAQLNSLSQKFKFPIWYFLVPKGVRNIFSMVLHRMKMILGVFVA